MHVVVVWLLYSMLFEGVAIGPGRYEQLPKPSASQDLVSDQEYRSMNECLSYKCMGL